MSDVQDKKSLALFLFSLTCTFNEILTYPLLLHTLNHISSSSGESLEPQAEAFQLLSTSVVTTPTDGR